MKEYKSFFEKYYPGKYKYYEPTNNNLDVYNVKNLFYKIEFANNNKFYIIIIIINFI